MSSRRLGALRCSAITTYGVVAVEFGEPSSLGGCACSRMRVCESRTEESHSGFPVADWWTQGSQLEPTLARIENADPVIVIMHEPLLFEQMPARVSLTLAGHTHGGQVNLPIIGPLFPLGP